MLSREPGEKLGISVQGGVGSRCGNPLDSTDEGIFISQVCGIVYNQGKTKTKNKTKSPMASSVIFVTKIKT